jgi:gas vesicle protein
MKCILWTKDHESFIAIRKTHMARRKSKSTKGGQRPVGTGKRVAKATGGLLSRAVTGALTGAMSGALIGAASGLSTRSKTKVSARRRKSTPGRKTSTQRGTFKMSGSAKRRHLWPQSLDQTNNLGLRPRRQQIDEVKNR